MLKNMQEENEGTDEGAVGGSTKKRHRCRKVLQMCMIRISVHSVRV